MIPPQLALFAAKHSKKLLIALAVGIVIAGVYFAVKMHERTVEQLAQSEAARAEQELAHEVTQASLAIQVEAAARWKAAAEEYQETLDAQNEMREEAASESRRVEESLPSGRLERLARAKPDLVEGAVNRGTARVIRLLNCSSTAAGCGDGDRGASGPDASDPLPPTARPGGVRVDSVRTGALARSGSGVLLSRPRRVRSSGA
jgi:hypothetical protein